MVVLITCAHCNINKFEKYRTKKYCDDCKILVLRERCKTYKANNRDKIKEYNKINKEENKEKYAERTKIWSKENRDIINEKQRIYANERRKTDFSFKLSGTMRNRLYKVLNGGSSESLSKLLGCSYDMLKSWIEYQFSPEMNFDNHGSVWQLDHVIACARFELKNEDEQKMCFHWSNIQPLESSKNMSKKASLSLREIHLHEIKVFAFIRQNKSLKYNHASKHDQYEIVIQKLLNTKLCD